jgi:predicted enzyme related to lactoylglutathione lyase
MTMRRTIAFALILTATAWAEDLPRKSKSARETYPNVDVIYDSVIAPDGNRLRTIITKPHEAKAKLPVIFVAGWLSCDSVEAPPDTKDATGLVFQGRARLPQFSLFRVDKQGVGDSDGNCEETDFESELGGYRAAFRALKNYDFIDSKRVYMLGISNGGGFAPLVPESESERAHSRVKIKAIGFVGIPVTNMNRAREFYEGVLGLVPDTEMTGEHWTEYPIGGGTLTLASVGEQWKPSQDGTSAALEVDNLDAAMARLEERKVSYDKVDSPVCQMAVIEDPDGNKLIIHKLKSEN